MRGFFLLINNAWMGNAVYLTISLGRKITGINEQDKTLVEATIHLAKNAKMHESSLTGFKMEYKCDSFYKIGATVDDVVL